MTITPYLINFFVGILVSFVSSIPLGPVGLAIVQASVEGNLKKAIKIALGSAFMETIYCLIAVLGFYSIMENSNVAFYIQVISIPVLIGMGGYNLFHKIPRSYHLNKRSKNAFLLGILLCLMNPLLIPYWIAISTYLGAQGFLYNSFPFLYSYVVGVFFGTLSLMVFLGYLTYKSLIQINYTLRVAITRIIGFVFLGFAIYTALKVFNFI